MQPFSGIKCSRHLVFWYFCLPTTKQLVIGQNALAHPTRLLPAMESIFHRLAGCRLFFASCKVWGLPAPGWGSGFCDRAVAVHQQNPKKKMGYHMLSIPASSSVCFTACRFSSGGKIHVCLRQAHCNFTVLCLQYSKLNGVTWVLELHYVAAWDWAITHRYFWMLDHNVPRTAMMPCYASFSRRRGWAKPGVKAATCEAADCTGEEKREGPRRCEVSTRSSWF